MDDEVFEDYDRELELALYREYRDVVSQFQYVIETERRFYLANEVNVVRRDTEHDFYFEITMTPETVRRPRQNSVGEPMNDQDARWCRLIPCSRIASRWSGLA